MTQKIRIVIADDHPIVRRGLRTVLKTQSDMELVAQAENGAVAVEKVMALQPDIVIMDLQMPVMDGLSAIQELNKLHSPTRIVVLTSFPDDDRVVRRHQGGRDRHPPQRFAAQRIARCHSPCPARRKRVASHDCDEGAARNQTTHPHHVND